MTPTPLTPKQEYVEEAEKLYRLGRTVYLMPQEAINQIAQSLASAERRGMEKVIAAVEDEATLAEDKVGKECWHCAHYADLILAARQTLNLEEKK